MNEITVNLFYLLCFFLLLLNKLNLFFPEFFNFTLYLFLRFIVFILTFPKCFISAVCGKKNPLYKFQILKCTFLMYIGAK